MGRLPDVVPDTPIESAWGNTIRDRTPTPFVNAAERAAQWITPPAGAMSFLDDVDALEVFTGTAWVPVHAGDNPYQTWVPTWYGAGANMGNAVYVARYSRLGRRVMGYLSVNLDSGSAMASDQLAIALPVPAYNAGQTAVIAGLCAYWDSASYRFTGAADIVTSQPDRMRLWTEVYNGISQKVFSIAVNGNAPFAWSPSPIHSFNVSFSYEAA